MTTRTFEEKRKQLFMINSKGFFFSSNVRYSDNSEIKKTQLHVVEFKCIFCLAVTVLTCVSLHQHASDWFLSESHGNRYSKVQ